MPVRYKNSEKNKPGQFIEPPGFKAIKAKEK